MSSSRPRDLPQVANFVAWVWKYADGGKWTRIEGATEVPEGYDIVQAALDALHLDLADVVGFVYAIPLPLVVDDSDSPTVKQVLPA